MKIKFKRKIIYIIDSLKGVGGMEKHVLQVVKGLPGDRYDCKIITFINGKTEITTQLADLGIPIFNIQYNRAFSFRGVTKAIQLYKLLKTERPDIVETFHHSADTFGVLVAKLAGAKNIISNKRDLAQYKTRLQRMMSKFINNFITHYFAVCENIAKKISADENIPLNKFTVQYNGVLSTDQQIETINLPNQKKTKKKFTIVCIANLRIEKGIHYLIHAVYLLKSKGFSIQTYILGAGPCKKQLLEIAKDLDLRKEIHFTGHVTNVKEYVKNADMCCLPATSNEGFSNGILEAMSAGKPVVATDVGGNAEAVENGANGFIVPAGDFIALAAAIEKLIKNQSMRLKMGNNCYQSVKINFNIKSMIASLDAFYSALMNGEVQSV
jgi:L-malate glycosyltransferase